MTNGLKDNDDTLDKDYCENIIIDARSEIMHVNASRRFTTRRAVSMRGTFYLNIQTYYF